MLLTTELSSSLLFLKQGLNVHPWLAWSLLFRPSWSQTHSDLLVSPSTALGLKVCATLPNLIIKVETVQSLSSANDYSTHSMPGRPNHDEVCILVGAEDRQACAIQRQWPAIQRKMIGGESSSSSHSKMEMCLTHQTEDSEAQSEKNSGKKTEELMRSGEVGQGEPLTSHSTDKEANNENARDSAIIK